MTVKNKPFWGVVGFLFILLGMTSILAIAIQPEKSLIGIIISGISIILGVLVIAWAYGEVT